MVIATGVNWLLNHFAVRRECKKASVPYTYKGCWDEKSVLWKFSFPALVSSLFFLPTEWALNAMLVNQPDGYAQMGIFNAANQWQVIILYVPSAIYRITLPILSNLFGEGDKRKYEKVLLMNSLALTGLALVVAVPVALVASRIMGAYGKDFVSGQNVLLLVCLYSVLCAPNMVVGQALWTIGAAMDAMILAAMRAAILFCSGLFLVKYGALGLSFAFVIAIVLQTGYQTPYVRYRLVKRFRSVVTEA
jgi:O-antigen/teichoic acid export membrane protein